MRVLYAAGWSFVAVAGVALYQWTQPSVKDPAQVVEVPVTVEPVATAPAQPTSWFEGMRAHCNPVEVEVTMASTPAPADLEGQAYAAACYALAGKIERAGERIDALPESQREWAATIVFDVGHPVADAGDDDAAGPIMELVLRYSPTNYMALYHAGIAEAHLGEGAKARVNLDRFLELYPGPDGWTESARSALAGLAG